MEEELALLRHYSHGDGGDGGHDHLCRVLRLQVGCYNRALKLQRPIAPPMLWPR